MSSQRSWKRTEVYVVLVLTGAALLLSLAAWRRVPIPGLTRGDVGYEKTTIKAEDLVRTQDLCAGEASSPYKIVMFGDYECPPCRGEWPKVMALVSKHKGALGVYFRNLPLIRIHPDAFGAATAAEVAKKMGKYKQAHELLYDPYLLDVDTGKVVSEEKVKSILSKIGISSKRFESERYNASNQVLKDMQLAKTYNVTSTPTFFLVDKENTVYYVEDIDSIANML